MQKVTLVKTEIDRKFEYCVAQSIYYSIKVSEDTVGF